MKIFLLVLGIIGLVLGPWTNLASASDVRVNSTGGLSLVLTDETTEITPYTLGNPAGMALLPPGGSFDASLNWYNLTELNNPIHETRFGISSGLIPPLPNLSTTLAPLNATTGSQYQGLLYVTPDKWAIQAIGGFGVSQTSFNNSDASERTESGEELVRFAHEFGLLSLGTELQFSEIGINDQSPNETDQSTGSAGYLNTGLLGNFQLGGDDHPLWLRAGGSFSFNVSTPQQTEISKTSVLGVGTQISTSSGTVFEPCLFVDIPGSFQGGIVMSFQNQSNYYGVTFTGYSPANQTFSPNGTLSNETLAVLYKCKMQTADEGNAHPFSFNHGALFEVTTSNTTDSYPAGITILGSTTTTYNAQLGVGVEWEKDLTLGIQGDWNGTKQWPIGTVGGSELLNKMDGTWHLAFGGEKWIIQQWAFRVGFNYENTQAQTLAQNDSGMTLFAHNGQSNGLTGTLGIGYEQKGFRADGMFWCEQTREMIGSFGTDLLGFALDAALLF